MKKRLSINRSIAALAAVAIALTAVAVSNGGPGDGSGRSTKAKKGTAKSLSVFRRIQKSQERELLPSHDRMPGVREFGADPSKARRVETGDGPP